MFDFIIINPLTNAILGLYMLMGENLGLAIISFTLILKTVLLPLTIRQIRYQRKMMDLQPKLQEIQQKRLESSGEGAFSSISSQEAKVMRQTASGCFGILITMLIQIPILIGLNIVINRIASANSGDTFNEAIYFDVLKHDAGYKFNTVFLGIDLATTPNSLPFDVNFIPIGILMILLVASQFILTTFMTIYQERLKLLKQNSKKLKKDLKKRKNMSEEEIEKQKMQEEMQKMMQVQTKYLFPFMIGFATYNFVSALGLYWLIQNTYTIFQTLIQNNIRDRKPILSFGIFKEVRELNIKAKEKKQKFEQKELKKKEETKNKKKKKNSSKEKSK